MSQAVVTVVIGGGRWMAALCGVASSVIRLVKILTDIENYVGMHSLAWGLGLGGFTLIKLLSLLYRHVRIEYCLSKIFHQSTRFQFILPSVPILCHEDF